MEYADGKHVHLHYRFSAFHTTSGHFSKQNKNILEDFDQNFSLQTCCRFDAPNNKQTKQLKHFSVITKATSRIS